MYGGAGCFRYPLWKHSGVHNQYKVFAKMGAVQISKWQLHYQYLLQTVRGIRTKGNFETDRLA